MTAPTRGSRQRPNHTLHLINKNEVGACLYSATGQGPWQSGLSPVLCLKVSLRSDLKRADKQAILKRDKYRCFYCGKKLLPDDPDATVDHKVPLSSGGSNDEANLVAACYPCNNKKGRGEQVRIYRKTKQRVWTKPGGSSMAS